MKYICYYIINAIEPQACSSFFVSASVSIKWFREIPIFFPSTFTYNELVLLASIFANGLFAFCMHFSLVSFTNTNFIYFF